MSLLLLRLTAHSAAQEAYLRILRHFLTARATSYRQELYPTGSMQLHGTYMGLQGDTPS